MRIIELLDLHTLLILPFTRWRYFSLLVCTSIEDLSNRNRGVLLKGRAPLEIYSHNVHGTDFHKHINPHYKIQGHKITRLQLYNVLESKRMCGPQNVGLCNLSQVTGSEIHL